MPRKCFLILAACAILAASTFTGCLQFFEQLPHKQWGFIDKDGILVIPVKFDDVARDEYGGRTLHHKAFRNFSEDLCAVRLGKKWGFIDKKGNFVIAPKYDNAGCFSEGLACVRTGAKYGYIDATGKEVIPLEFDWPPQSSQVSSDDPDWDFSKSLVEPLVFSEGMAVARNGDKCGYIDHTGKMVIAPTFLGAQPFDNGFAMVTTASGAALMEKSGKLTNPESHCIGFADGLFLAHSGLYTPDKRRLFYLHKDDQRAFPQDFVDARVFSEGLAAVAPVSEPLNTSTVYGYIDTTGTMVIKPQFYVSGNNLAADFVDGRAIVSQLSTSLTGGFRNLHGVIDRSGHWIVPPKYDHISAYSEGLARALIHDRWLFLDKEGHEAVQTPAPWVNSYSDGLAAVMQ